MKFRVGEKKTQAKSSRFPLNGIDDTKDDTDEAYVVCFQDTNDRTNKYRKSQAFIRRTFIQSLGPLQFQLTFISHFWWQLCRFTPCSAHNSYPLNSAIFPVIWRFSHLVSFPEQSKQQNYKKRKHKKTK